MNERIRELAKQAMVFSSENGGWRISTHVPNDFQEKFAELIVRECIETLRLVPYNSDREFGDEVIYQDAVKRHFGIEE